MKKFITSVLILAAVLSFSLGIGAFAAEETPVTVYVDGVQLSFDTEPVIENGRTLVPMRAIFEALGAKVDWTDQTKTAHAETNGITIDITAGSNVLYKNGRPIELDGGAKITDSRMLVPARAVSEGLDVYVDWHANARRVVIVSSNAESFKTLSEADNAIFDSRYPGLRTQFEQELLYSAVQSSAAEYAEGIITANRLAVEYVAYVWDSVITNALIEIQSESETVYIVNEYENLTESQIAQVYKNIAAEKNVSSRDVLSAEFADYGGVLVTFASANEKDSCRYIAIAESSGGIRFFTARTAEDNKKLCNVVEITDNGLTDCGISVKDEDAFVTAVEKILNK